MAGVHAFNGQRKDSIWCIMEDMVKVRVKQDGLTTAAVRGGAACTRPCRDGDKVS